MDNDNIIGVPICGVIGAISPEGNPIYVIQAKHGSLTTAGNYEEGNEYAEFQHYGVQSSMDWEFLVLSKEAVCANHTLSDW